MRNTDSAAESESQLHLHRVLEDEYVLMHGPLPRAYPWLVLLNHLKKVECFVNRLQERHSPENPSKVSDHLRVRLRSLMSVADVARLNADIARLEKEVGGGRAAEGTRDELVRAYVRRGDASRAAGRSQEALDDCRRALRLDPDEAQRSIDEFELLKQIEDAAEPYPDGLHLGHEGRLKKARALAGLLNRLLEDTELYKKDVFIDAPRSGELRDLVGWLESARENNEKVCGGDVARLNRLLLEHAYPEELAKVDDSEMRHVPAELREKLRGSGAMSRLQETDQDSLNAVRLAAVYSLLHKHERSALCLSGGGIRSATFNLGVLQGLARHRLLPKFDYLSTVSGGGYIGSWLSAWVYREREGAKAVSKALGKKPDSVLEPEPEPIDWLRDYSNHQTPRVGVLSADFWTLVGVYLRNLFLNWLSFIPLLAAALMLPRIGVAMVGRPLKEWQMPVLLLGFGAAAVAAAFTGVSLPSSGKLKFTASAHARKCMLPLIASALLFSSYWVCPEQAKTLQARDAVGGAIAVGLAGLVAYIVARMRRHYDPKCYGLWKIIFLIAGGFVLVTLASSLTGLLGWKVLSLDAWGLAQEGDGRDKRIFVTLGVPTLLLLYLLGGTLCAGFTSRWTGEDDQEWWARSGASLFLFIVGWVLLCALVLFLPEYLFKSWGYLRASNPRALLGVAAAAVGVASGLFTLLAGFSNKTNAGAPGKDGGVSFVQSASKLAAPVFFCFLIVVVAALTNYLMVNFSRLADVAVDWYLRDRTNILPDWLAQALRVPKWVFYNLGFGAPVHAASHQHLLEQMRLRQCLVLFFSLVGFGWVMGMIIDSNKFSLHSYYGNRLKRTFLGASREDREGNKFTGFDYCDNIQMHELRPTWIQRRSFKSPQDLDRVIARVRRHSHDDEASKFIHERLLPVTLGLVDDYDPDRGDASNLLRSAFIHELNRLVEEETFPVLEEARMHPHAKALVERGAQGESRVYLNRLILQCAYRREMHEYKPPKLFHVVNMALNLAWSDKLAWQERKAETFTASPLHTGNHWLGYRRSRYYGGDNGISLGTAFTISGAAANPNMGYMLSSPLASFLMSMFNVRLGWWLGNPGPAGDRTFQRDVPRFVLGPVVQEALSLADDRSRYVYLSDGGHFENLGLYEMVLRRCKLIVVSDASTDADYSFESLGGAIRKIRIDLGIPIEFEKFRFVKGDGCGGRHCAVANVRYSCVDEDGTDGVLVYIKPSLSGNEPRDILNYQVGNKKFPQDPIADQFFDEPQFESYRMLGSHVIEDITGEVCEEMKLWQFVAKAYDHWRDNEPKYKAPWLRAWLGDDYRDGHRAAPSPDGARKAARPSKAARQRARAHGRVTPHAPAGNGTNGNKARVKVEGV